MDAALAIDLDALRRSGVSDLVVAVVSWRNAGRSWRELCGELGISRAIARAAHGEAVRRLAAVEEARLAAGATSGGDELRLRGVPVIGRGVPGAARWSTPGSPAWIAELAGTDSIPRQGRRQGPSASR